MKVRLLICTYTPRHKSTSLLFDRLFNSYQKEDIRASFLSLIELHVSIANSRRILFLEVNIHVEKRGKIFGT